MGSKTNNIIRIQGILLLVLAASMLAPLIIAWNLGESSSIKAFSLVIAFCLAGGIIIRKVIKPSSAKFKVRDGFFVVSLTWVICSFIGALPFLLSGATPSIADAIFESCSGFSTTGASILTDIEALPKSILFWRSFTHWLGGMGIVVIVAAFLPVLGISGQIAANAETPGPTKDKLTARFADTARNLYKIYVVLTLAQVLLLKIGGMSLYDAFVHTFGTIGTGGFSNYNNSVAHFQSPYIQLVIILFMIIAGTNFNLFYLVKWRGPKLLLQDEEVKFYLTVIGIATLAVFLVNSFYNHFKEIGTTFLNSLFQVVSIITTTGFSTDNYDLWPTFSRMIILCLFFFGACSSSTAGGIKCIRVLLYLKMIRRSFSLRIHPNRIVHISINNVDLSTEVLIKCSNFLFTYILVLFFGTLMISINNFDFMTSFSAAATCIGNIGPGFNVVGPANNFSVFSDFSKLVCSFLMIAGRLELITVLALFSRFYWNSNKAK